MDEWDEDLPSCGFRVRYLNFVKSGSTIRIVFHFIRL